MERAFTSSPLFAVMSDLAARTPAPGGGGAVAIAAATGAATVQMAVAFSAKAMREAAEAPSHAETIKRLETQRRELLASADRDAEAFERLQDAQRLAKETGEASSDDVEQASRACIGVPRDQLRISMDILRLAAELAKVTNPRLASDLAIGAVLAEAAVNAAAWNIRVNLGLLRDESVAASIREQTDREIAEAMRLRTQVAEVCQRRSGG